MSNIEEPRQVVARTMAEWQALWKELDAQRAAPVVDFAQSIVVVVFLGTRPTAGFAVDSTGVKTEGSRTIVEYRERRPPGDALLAQVLTSPFHIVRLARTGTDRVQAHRRSVARGVAWIMGPRLVCITCDPVGRLRRTGRIPPATTPTDPALGSD
jgi:hypothetical protein